MYPVKSALWTSDASMTHCCFLLTLRPGASSLLVLLVRKAIGLGALLPRVLGIGGNYARFLKFGEFPSVCLLSPVSLPISLLVRVKCLNWTCFMDTWNGSFSGSV